MPTLREFEKKLLDGFDANQDSIEKMKQILWKISEGKETFKDFKTEIDHLKKNSKSTKLSSMELSVAAVGATILTGVVVPVCPAAGAAIKPTAEMVEYYKIKGFIKKSNDVMSNLKELIEEMQTIQNNYQKSMKFFQDYFKLENDKASSIFNTFFAMSKKLSNGVEKTGSIGVLIMVLAVANPCSTDFQSPGVTKAASNAGAENEDSLSGAVKTGGTLAAEIGIHGAMADLGTGSTVWDIVSIVQSWNNHHLTVEAIDNAILKLIQVENAVQSQLNVMVDTMDDSELPIEKPSDSQDKVRIYEKTTDTMKEILQSLGLSGISKAEDHRYRTVPDLVSLLQMILDTIGNHDGQRPHFSPNIQFDFDELVGKGSTFILSSYFLMMDLIHVLITLHGAVFSKSKASSLELKVPAIQTSILFGCNERNYFRELLFPIYKITNIPLENNGQLCCIYRLHCVECAKQGNNEFNYVGQSRHFQAGHESQTGEMLNAWIDNQERMAGYEEGVSVPDHVTHPPSSLLNEHAVQVHPKRHKFSDIYELDIVYNLQENFTNTTHRVRHSWEVYYQWLFKARTSECTGSIRR